MKIKIEQQSLAAGLKKAQSALAPKSPMAILNHFKLTATNGGLTICATDLDLQISIEIAADVLEDGSLSVPARLFSDIVNKAPKGELISITHADNLLNVKIGRTSAKIATLPADDFPIMASDEYEAQFSMISQELQTMFFKTQFAASTDEARYHLNGVYIHHDRGDMVAVATDGHRLAKRTTCVDGEFPSVIVPNKTVAAIQIDDADTVEVSVSASKIKFSTPRWSMVSKVVDGSFPDYTRVIPSGCDSRAEFSGSSMKRAIDIVASVLTEDKSKGVSLSFDQDGITVHGQQSANVVDGFIDATYDGEPVQVWFNANYLAGATRYLDGNCIMRINDASSPAIIEDDADPDFLLVVMPMRGNKT